jgi:hypothetical protein
VSAWPMTFAGLVFVATWTVTGAAGFAVVKLIDAYRRRRPTDENAGGDSHEG